MSEFGTGFAYNLGLFLAHADAPRRLRLEQKILEEKGGDTSIMDWPEMWFKASVDHLYDLKIPENFSEKVTAEELERKCFEWRLPMDKPIPTPEDVEWAIQTAKDLLRAWDIQCGIESEKGEWE